MSSKKPVNLAPYLTKLIVHPPTLEPADLVKVFDAILDAENPASDVQMAAFFALLRGSGIDQLPTFIAAAAQRMMKEANRLELKEDLPLGPDSKEGGDKATERRGYIDIVGTGGDGQNTFNVSTTASIVASGIPGLNICKHGGKAATSASGAGDLLTCLGINLSNVTNKTAPAILASSKYCFLFAPVFHPAMAKIAVLRKELGIPTIFNVLGPLLNPAPLRARIIGVYSEALGEVFARAVHTINKDAGNVNSRAMIVWGTEGLDEISPAGTTKVWTVDPVDGTVTVSYLHPNDFGLPVHPLDTVRSGTPQENAEVVKKLVNGTLEDGHPVLDYVLMNVAAIAVLDGKATDYKHGVELAKESIRSGNAKAALETFVKLSSQ